MYKQRPILNIDCSSNSMIYTILTCSSALRARTRSPIIVEDSAN